MKITDEEYKKLGETFSQVWAGTFDEEKLKKDFMEAIDSIHMWSTSEEGPIHENIYNAPHFYKSMGDAIECFQHLYHIVSVTKEWGNKK